MRADQLHDEQQQREKRIARAGMPKEAREKAKSELAKLKLMSPMSAEATVVRNYIDWLGRQAAAGAGSRPHRG